MLFLSVFLTHFSYTRADIVSLETCYYESNDGECNILRDECEDKCETEPDECENMTCDLIAIGFMAIGMSAYDECFTSMGFMDTMISCDDGGTLPCDGDDICMTVCFLSDTGDCYEPCIEYGMDLEGQSCDSIESSGVYGDNFAWGECSFYNGSDVRMVCTEPGSSSSNTGMIIGIVIGCIVVIALIAGILFFKCKKKSTL